MRGRIAQCVRRRAAILRPNRRIPATANATRSDIADPVRREQGIRTLRDKLVQSMKSMTLPRKMKPWRTVLFLPPFSASLKPAVAPRRKTPPTTITTSREMDDPEPSACITTTAGTGTEADPWTVITKEDTQEKIGFGFKGTFPTMSIVDPELMLSVPPKLTAYQGFDALFHAVEGVHGHDCLSHGGHVRATGH